MLDDGGLPLGLQVLGFPQGDADVFAINAWIEMRCGVGAGACAASDANRPRIMRTSRLLESAPAEPLSEGSHACRVIQ
jgi:hypothetical protein